MSTIGVNETARSQTVSHGRWLGLCFMHPVLDYLLVGGGLSLLVIPYVLWNPGITPTDPGTTLTIFLIFNYAHFAASTVRLYSKPGSRQTFRFLCYGFPVVALAVVTTAIVWPQHVGQHLWALMLTWSPYHYAAQAYGLAVIYSFRSGCILTSREKRMLWWISLLPFFRAFVSAPDAGLAWFVPGSVFESLPVLGQLQYGAVHVMDVLIFLLPLWLYQRCRFRLPLISILLLVANGIWWVTLSYTEAWIWATIFHAIQYLAIVMIYHVRDRLTLQGNLRGPAYHAITFYAFSFLLGYCLFVGLPTAYGVVGFDGKETALMIAAAINIHHFVVDGYIWRTKRKKPRAKVSHVAGPSAT